MNINLKPLLLSPLIFIFLPAFVFVLPGTKMLFSVFYIALLFCLAFVIILKPQYTISKIKDVIKKTPFKYIGLFFLFSILDLFLLNAFGIVKTKHIFYTIFLTILLYRLPFFFYFIIILDKYISIENFIKKIVVIYWTILIIGFLSYIGQFFDVTIINSIFDFFANKRIIAHSFTSEVEKAVNNYQAFGLPRLDNLFEEPGWYASFLFLMLPISYSFGLSNISLIKKHPFLNKFILKTIIPFSWISIILTFSPISLILSIIFSFYYFRKEIFKLMKYIISFLMIFAIYIKNINLEETYFSRIINVFLNIKSFEDFILIEPSLATRVVSYINTFIIFIKNPITGVGLNNTNNVIYYQFQNSPVPLTPELIEKTTSLGVGEAFANRGYIYALLAENGFFISLLLIYFFYLSYKYINKKMKITTTQNMKYNQKNINYVLIKSLQGVLVSIFILSFYELDIQRNYLYLFCIIIFMLLYRDKRKTNA